MFRKLIFAACLLMLSVSTSLAQVAPVPDGMNFQGRLADPMGNPVSDGNHMIQFSLWNSIVIGTQRWVQTIPNVRVQNGTFAVYLSGFHPGLFNSDLWLEIKIDTAAPLVPRQRLVSVPYAFKSALALSVPNGSITAASIATGAITSAQIAAGTITADKLAPGVLSGSGWLLGGNSGVTSGFLGTLDNNPLVLKVNNRQVMRYSYGENMNFPGMEYRSISSVGGSDVNGVGAGVVGATIAGGGLDSFTGTDGPNQVWEDFGTIGGGVFNQVFEFYGTIAGGAGNGALGVASTVSGGVNNIAMGSYSTIAGGNSNMAAADYSFAAGRRAQANTTGSFVWADSTDADFASTGDNQFLIRAGGGVGINTDNPNGFALKVAGTAAVTGLHLSTGAGSGKTLISDAGGNGTWGQISAAGIANGSITANKFAPNLFNSTAWLLGGNNGVTTSFLGTVDNNPLEFRANNRRVMRYSYAEFTASAGAEYRSMNVLGGSEINSIGAGVVGATIAGGGQDYFSLGAYPNRVLADFGTVSGGSNNTASGYAAGIGGGHSNTASNLYASVGGGVANIASGVNSTIGGGINNQASGTAATIVGGDSNMATGNSATVVGGYSNVAGGGSSYAAGTRAKANHYGTWVWGDGTSADFASTGINQFLIRAGGGLGVNTNTLRGDFDLRSISGNADLYLQAGGAALGVNFGVAADGTLFLAHYNGTAYTDRMILASNGFVGIGRVPSFLLDVNGTIRVSSTTYTSDARYKKNIETLPSGLEAILGLRGVMFDWKTGEYPDMNFANGRQIGFIAQEVEKVLPELVTTDSKGYKSVAYANVVPVLVEAVKTLNRKVERLNKVEAENAELKARLDAIERTLTELTGKRH